MHNKLQMRKKLTIYVTALLGMLVLFNSCKKEYESIESIDEAKIQAYIKQNNLTMNRDDSGFFYQLLNNGTGPALLNKDSVFYTVSLKSLSGTTYYSTPAYNVEGNYFGYLSPEAYRTALTGANHGATIRVILPSYLAYGKNGNSTVPSNEVIVAEISTRPETTQWQIDDTFIKNFLTANNITAVKASNRVYYKINTAGTGAIINIGSTIEVKYTGRLLNGTVFDTSGDTAYSSALLDFISGWEALIGMKAGTKVRLIIPSDLAYGSVASSSIPSNSILDFDVEIVSVTN
jgi:FKBP-type peptidyl-prolyl cis-trans isomerase